MTAARHRTVEACGRVYATMLRLMPADFRVQYGETATLTFTDMCAEGLQQHGYRALVTVWWKTAADLVACAALERVDQLSRSVDRPPAASRLSAATVPTIAALLVTYSQLRYPANLSLASYGLLYVLLVAALAAAATALILGRSAAPVTAICALATTPAWIAMFLLDRASADIDALLVVSCLIAVGSTIAARSRASCAVAVRAGGATGALTGLVMLVVTVADGLFRMATVDDDRVYVAEFVRSGQHSLAAYVIGERIVGALATTAMTTAAGALIGLTAYGLAVLQRSRAAIGRR